jgi:predicted transposase YdaD
LAPIADVSSEELPQVVRQMEQRIVPEASPVEAASLWTAAFVLMGLIYLKESIEVLFQGMHNMKDSVTYQAILEEGREEGRAEGETKEAIKILKKLGTRRLGPPDLSVLATIEAITDVERIESLSERLLDVSSWEELLTEK